jgi:hypothetical protein
MVVNDEFEIMILILMEFAVAFMKVLYQRSSGEIDENYEKPWSKYVFFGPRKKDRNFRVRSRRINYFVDYIKIGIGYRLHYRPSP